MPIPSFVPGAFSRILVMVPAFVSGLWLTHSPDIAVQTTMRTVALQTVSESHVQAFAQPSRSQKLELIETRKERITQVLDTLEQIADVSSQMAPERASSIEPVIVDLAERTLELSDESVIAKPGTETKLSAIEATVERLVTSLNSVIEPEMTL